MNKKIIAGLMSAAAVGTFWACGSGDINSATKEDELVSMQFKLDDGVDTNTIVTIVNSLIDPAKEACKADVICNDQHKDYLNGIIKSSSSIAATSSSSVVDGTSSAGTIQSSSSKIVIASSSSVVIIPTESSSSVAAGGGNTVTGLGTCAPVTTPVDKGTAAQFKFAANTTGSGYTAIDFAQATFTWSYGTGVGDGSANLLYSDKVTYAASGTATASVTVTMSDGSSETVQCSPLQVNGDPITGCSCTADAATADVAAGGVATWTIAGCTSASEITSYTWTGATGTATTATYTFTEKGQTLTPSVDVGNADNTVQTVACATVSAIDATQPDYSISSTADKVTIPAGKATVVMNLAENWHNGTTGTCTFYCQTASSLTGTVDGTAISGANYVTVSIPITSTIGGYALAVELSAEAECGVNW